MIVGIGLVRSLAGNFCYCIPDLHVAYDTCFFHSCYVFLFTMICEGKLASLVSLFFVTAETETDAVASESKTQKEAVDFKELMRIDKILVNLQKKVILSYTLVSTECLK
jgi:hypothetical protein